jgi:hypothetical protein
MTKSHTTIDPITKHYWHTKLVEFRKRAGSPPPFDDKMPDAQRRFFTRNSQGQLIKNDFDAAQLLIEQAMRTLKDAGFDDDETALLRTWSRKAAPKGKRGQAQVQIIDKLAIHYFYTRITGQDESQSGPLTEILTPEFTHDTPAHVDAASNLAPNDMNEDERHRLNKTQTCKLLREEIGVSQNTLGRILNSGIEKS